MTANIKERQDTKIAGKLIKSLTLAFGLVSLGGCATMNYTGLQDCVVRRGSSLSLPVLSVQNRNDSFSEDCATARAATTISSMKKADGTPDMAAYALAVSLYQQSNQHVREFMDKMLKEQGTSMTQIQFDLDKTKEPVSCARQETTNPDGTKSSGFLCTPKTAPAAAAAAPRS